MIRTAASAALLGALALAPGHSAGEGNALVWRVAAPGLEMGERRVDDVQVVAVRIDPARYRFRLDAAISPGGTRPEWTIDHAPASVALALNGGQFTGAAPWGWIVHEGLEARPPGFGPLSTAIVFGRDGRVRLVDASSIATVRDSGVALEAVQSYPTLLRGNGEVPAALSAATRGIDLTHRDGRLAIGVLADGRVVIALTRYTLGSRVPIGPTVPEMAAIMRTLGCLRAVSLDGGLSSQLLVRDSAGSTRAWHGSRAVPIGLLASLRQLP